jgi:hypothetical protein
MARSYRMPSCNCADQDRILDAIERLRGDGRTAADELVDEIGPKEVCLLLHAMRRWYSFNTWNAAKKIVPHREVLDDLAMDLEPPIGAWRGFKVDRNSELADAEPGDVFQLAVERNGGCSSWTLQEKFAHRFSGASAGKVGLVVRLYEGRGAIPFIAPPCRTEPWFDRMYEITQGRSFRFNEQEYAIYGKRLTVEVARVKRR